MRDVLSSIEGEWRRYKTLGEEAVRQARDDELGRTGPGDGNSIAVIMSHVAGNLRSRFTDFLTADGEKSWRDRDTEFQPRPNISRAELMEVWDLGWQTLLGALKPLTDEDLSRTVTIRGEKFFVYEALHRLLAHTSYHVGQIVFLAKAAAGTGWSSLSIPKGQSASFNLNPTGQRPAEHIASLEQRSRGGSSA
jgi:hypothetical protein